MFCTFKNLSKKILLICSIVFAEVTFAQDGTIYPLATPAEPNAIPLNTGGVKDQPASETWFRQWGDPMARNITAATLTPFFPKPGTANGAVVIVAPGGGFRWLSMGNEGWEVWLRHLLQKELLRLYLNTGYIPLQSRSIVL